MKPRNKYEKHIVELKGFKVELGKTKEDWIESKMLKVLVFKYKKHICTECNHRWKGNIQDSILKAKNKKTVTCPNCKKRLIVSRTEYPTDVSSNQFGVFQQWKGYQIYRLFYVTKTHTTKNDSFCVIHEVQRHFIDENGRLTTLSCNRGGYNYYGSGWALYSGLEIRGHPPIGGSDYDLPNPSIRKDILRAGYNKNLIDDYHPQVFMSDLIAYPFVETIMKRNMNFIKYLYKKFSTAKGFSKYWPAIKVAYRHGERFKDPIQWFDHIRLLIKFKMDLQNPIYVAPVNFHKAHQIMIAKNQKHEDKLKKIRERKHRENKVKQKLKEIRERKDNLKQMKIHVAKYNHLVFTKGNLTVTVLKTIADYNTEAKDLFHCVNSKNYYFDFTSLMMSAKVNGKRTETIHIDLEYYEIEQSRGYDNLPSKYHKRIIKLVEDNIHLIIEAKTTIKRKKKSNKIKIAA